MARDRRLGGLTNRNVFCHHSRGWKTQVKVLADVASSETCLLSLQTHILATPSCSLLCVHPRREREKSVVLSYKDTRRGIQVVELLGICLLLKS